MAKPNDPTEREKWEWEKITHIAERAHDREHDFYVRTVHLINGAAAITLLAFIGNIVSSEEIGKSFNIGELTDPLIWFVWGTALATLAVGFAFFSNRAMVESSRNRKERYDEIPYVAETAKSKLWMKWTYALQVAAMISTSAALGFFIYGMFEIRNVITNLL